MSGENGPKTCSEIFGDHPNLPRPSAAALHGDRIELDLERRSELSANDRKGRWIVPQSRAKHVRSPVGVVDITKIHFEPNQVREI